MAASTAYQRLQKAAGAVCRGTGKVSTLKAAAAAYKKSAIKKGKPVAEATRIANKFVTKPCSVSPKKKGKTAVAGTRKKTAKRK